MFISVKTISSIFVEVFCRISGQLQNEMEFYTIPLPVEPVSSGQPVLSSHPTIPFGWLFNTGSTVLCMSVIEHWMRVHVLNWCRWLLPLIRKNQEMSQVIFRTNLFRPFGLEIFLPYSAYFMFPLIFSSQRIQGDLAQYFLFLLSIDMFLSYSQNKFKEWREKMHNTESF